MHRLTLSCGVLAGMPTPAIFADEAYIRSTAFGLSTSNTSNPGFGAEYWDCGGFGAPLTDCYGVNYQIQEHAIQMTISSDPNCRQRDARRFAPVVLSALADVYALIDSHASEVQHLVQRHRLRAKL